MVLITERKYFDIMCSQQDEMSNWMYILALTTISNMGYWWIHCTISITLIFPLQLTRIANIRLQDFENNLSEQVEIRKGLRQG